MIKIAAQRNIRRNGDIKCQSCSAKEYANTKPQCGPDFWNTERRSRHSKIMLESESYRAVVASGFFKKHGEANHRYGTKASSTTKARMSDSRRGKTGANATAWKGGKRSLNKMVKAALQKRHNWFGRVISRDAKCMKCLESGIRLDAHHIIPISTITKKLLIDSALATKDEQFEFLMRQPEVIDAELNNGVALCRPCHMNVHNNWGSKVNP